MTMTMNMHVDLKNWRRSLLTLAVASGVALPLGCGVGGDSPFASGELPPLDALFLASPQSDARGGAQAACADTAAIDALTARIDAVNADLEGQLAALEALASAEAVETATGIEVHAEADGGSVVLTTVEAAGAGTFEVRFTPEGGEEYVSMQGTRSGDEAGTLQLFDESNNQLQSVAWSNDGETLEVTRTRGAESVVFSRGAEEVDVVFSDALGVAVGRWNPETLEGVLIEDGLPTCFSAAAASDDFCDADCGDISSVDVDAP